MKFPTEQTRSGAFNLYLASCTVNIGALAAGCALTWSSPTIPKLEEGDPSAGDLIISRSEGGWIGSLIALGAAIGPLIAGALIDRFGRKRTILFAMVLFIISWLIIGFFPRLFAIYVARVIAGIAVGLIFMVNPLYIAEIAEPSLRSSLGTLMQFFLCTGFLVEYIIGPYTTYFLLVMVSLVPPLLCLATFVWMPETPQYLLRKPDNEKQALASLQWLRGNPTEEIVVKELNEMKNSLEKTMKQESGLCELFGSVANIRALLIAGAMVGFQQVSGINVVLCYSESIFKSTGSSMSASLSTIIVGSVMVFAAAMTPPLAKRFGMKALLYTSSIGMTITLGTLGFYFFLKSLGHDMALLSWLPVTSLILYIIAYCFGFGPLPWTIMGEIFPANLKAVASALTASFCWLLGFILTKSFMTLCDMIGEHFAFWMFSGFCILAFLFTKFLLPDTEGKTLQEIQDMLQGKATARDQTPTPLSIDA